MSIARTSTSGPVSTTTGARMNATPAGPSVVARSTSAESTCGPKALRRTVTQEATQRKLTEFREAFDIQADCAPDELERAARTAVALDELVATKDLVLVSRHENELSGTTDVASREEFAKEGDRIIVVAGMPFGTPGATNMVRIAHLGDER